MGRTVNPLSFDFSGSNPLLPTPKFFGFGNYLPVKCGSSSVGRAIAFQAIGRGFEPRLPLTTAWLCGVYAVVLACRQAGLSGINECRCSSVVEHFLGKEEVVSSILINGSNYPGKILF
jgi:hypothetical protein